MVIQLQWGKSMKLLQAEHFTRRKQERIYSLDWLRVLVLLGVFYSHNTYIFIFTYWHVQDKGQSSSMSILADILAGWGMSLFFVLAGASAWFALQSRTGRQFVTERFKRLVIPFLVAFILLAPPQAYFEALSRRLYQGSFLQFYPYFWTNIQLSWNPQDLATYGFHLWFLAFLFCISLLSLPLTLSLRSHRNFIARLGAFCERRGGMFVFVLPIALIQILLRAPFPGYRGWADFFSWLAFFVCGYVLFSDHHFERAIEKQGKLAALVGSMCVVIILAFFFAGFFEIWENTSSYSIGYLLYQILFSLNAWSWIVFALFIGIRFLNEKSKLLQYANETVLPFYLLHYLVTSILAFYMVQWNAGVVPTFLIISTSALIATLALYEFLVRRVPVMCWFFGMKARKPSLRTGIDMHEQKAEGLVSPLDISVPGPEAVDKQPDGSSREYRYARTF
jgi:hypothetical protein